MVRVGGGGGGGGWLLKGDYVLKKTLLMGRMDIIFFWFKTISNQTLPILSLTNQFIHTHRTADITVPM